MATPFFFFFSFVDYKVKSEENQRISNWAGFFSNQSHYRAQYVLFDESIYVWKEGSGHECPTRNLWGGDELNILPAAQSVVPASVRKKLWTESVYAKCWAETSGYSSAPWSVYFTLRGGGDLNSKMKGNEGEKRRRRKKSCTTVMMQPNDVDDVLDLDQEYEIASGNNALVNTAIPILGNELVIDCPRWRTTEGFMSFDGVDMYTWWKGGSLPWKCLSFDIFKSKL